jgi:hypothetical protein
MVESGRKAPHRKKTLEDAKDELKTLFREG